MSEDNTEFKIELDTTPRGFVIGEWKDLYGWKCTIQESSLAFHNAIWLGCSSTPEGEGLGPIDKISGEHIGARMHLDVEMVKALLPLLQHFVENGRLPDKFD